MLVWQIIGSFVPGADLRDIKANWEYKDYEMLFLSVAGLIPVAGDTPKATKAIGEFSQKNADKLDEVADLLNIVNKNMPDVAKGLGKSDEFVEAVQKLTKIDTAKLTREQAEAVREVLSEPELKKYLDEATNPWIRRAVDEGSTDIRVKPSNPPDLLAKPGGKRTIINYADPDPDNVRALTKENEAADTLARQGYVVEQNPIVPGSKNPDYLIEGEIFDCYSPKDGTSVRNIASGIQRKIDEGQTNRIILNLDDWHGGGGSIEDLIKQLNDWTIEGLEEVKIINHYHEVIDIYP